jgi:hypothetical protein
MKRLVLCLILSTSIAKAEDFAETWKTVSSYRVTSGAKAILAAFLGYHSVAEAWRNSGKFVTAGKNLFNGNDKLEDRLGQVGKYGALGGGMWYVSYKLWWEHFIPNAKHALAVK